MKKVEAHHRLMAVMVAANWKNTTIGERLNMSPATVREIKRSPLFQTLVDRIVRDLVNKGIEETFDKLMADAPKNVRFLTDVRDGIFEEQGADPEHLRIRMSAGLALFDRQAPRRTENTETQRISITIDDKTKRAADEASREVGDPIYDAEYTPVEEQKALPAPTTRVHAIDDVIEKYRRQEEAEYRAGE